MSDNKISLGIDPSEAKKGRDQLIKYLRDIEKEASSTGSSMNSSLDIDSSGASGGVDDLSSSFDDASKSSEDLGDSSKSALGGIENSSESASMSMRDLAKRATVVAGAITAVAGATIAFVRSQAAYADDMSDIARIADMNASEFVRVAHAVELSGMSMDRFAGTMRDIKKATTEYVNYGSGRLSNLMDELTEKTDINVEAITSMAGSDGLLYLINSMKDAGFSMEDINGRLQKLNPNIHQITDNLVEMADGALGFSEIDLKATQRDFDRLAETHAEFEGLTAKTKDNYVILASTIASLDLGAMQGLSNIMDTITNNIAYTLTSFRNLQDLELDEIVRQRERLESQLFDDSWLSRMDGGARRILNIHPLIGMAIDDNTDKARKLTELYEEEARKRERLLDLAHSGKELTEEEKREVSLLGGEHANILKTLKERSDLNDDDDEIPNIRTEITERERLTQTIMKEVEALKFQVDTYGMTASEVIKFRMAHGDLSEAIKDGDPIVQQYVNSLYSMNEELDRLNSMKDAERILDGIQDKMKEIGATDKEKAIFKIEAQVEDLNIDDSMKQRIIEAREELYIRDKEQSFIEQARTEMEQLKIQLQELNEFEGILDPQVYGTLKENMLNDMEEIKIANDEILTSFRDLGEESRAILGDTFKSIFEGDAQGAFDNMVSSFQSAIAQMLADQALAQLGQMMAGLGGGTGGGGGFGAFLSGMFPGRRSGGFVSKNQPYMVGETGPEVFYPEQSGAIDNMKGSSGGKGGSNNMSVSINFGDIQAPNSRAREEAANKIAARTTQAIQRTTSRGDI